ncbi:hypothetical protein NCC49_004819 [Naganishia albida]|nr:hypothetical protein NCC49_004819 [Naganishia albida]
MKIGTTVLLIVSQVSIASAWMGRQVSQKEVVPRIGSDGNMVDGLIASDPLTSVASRDPSAGSQCESQLVSRLKLTCHDTEADRIGVSIALTLCSITSARQQPPSECEVWSVFASDQAGAEGWRNMPDGGATNVDKRGRCLEALHRSPQDWSSYNGFLSNAMQLCHALHGKQQQEMAKSIYANISQEKMELLRFLKTNEEVRQQEQGKNQAELQEGIEALTLVHQSARQQHHSLAELIARSATQEDAAHYRLLQSIEEFRNMGEGWWEEIRRRVREQLDVDIASTKGAMEVQVAEMRGLLDLVLFDVAEKQRAEVQAMAAQYRSSQDSAWEREQLRIAQLVGSIALVTNDVAERVEGLGLQLSHHSELLQSLDSASNIAGRLPSVLEMAMRHSQALYSLQLVQENATHRNLALTNNVNDKLMKTLEIVEHSNIALEELKEEITRQSNMGVSFWRYLEFAGSFLPYFSSQSFMTLRSQPFFSPIASLITTFSAVCFNALAFAFYSITTIWVVFRTGIWRLGRRACSLLYSEYQALRQEHLNDVERA